MKNISPTLLLSCLHLRRRYPFCSFAFSRVQIRVAQASDSVFHRCHVENQQKPRRTTGKFEIGNYLRQMDRVHAFDRLEFDDNHSFDGEVKAKAAIDVDAFVRQLDVSLVLEAQLRMRQLDEHAFPVHRFEETRPQSLMDLDRAADDCLG